MFPLKMVLIEIPKFVKTRTLDIVFLSVFISLLIGSIVFTFSFFLRDLLYGIMKKYDLYIIVDNVDSGNYTKFIIIHLVLLTILALIAIGGFIFLRHIYISRKIK